jgi:hypothetical protein
MGYAILIAMPPLGVGSRDEVNAIVDTFLYVRPDRGPTGHDGDKSLSQRLKEAVVSVANTIKDTVAGAGKEIANDEIGYLTS